MFQVNLRIEDDEMESESIYKFSGNDGNDDNHGTHEEPEQLHVNHIVAEMELHQQLNQSNSINGEECDKGVLDSLHFHYTQQQMKCK